MSQPSLSLVITHPTPGGTTSLIALQIAKQYMQGSSRDVQCEWGRDTCHTCFTSLVHMVSQEP